MMTQHDTDRGEVQRQLELIRSRITGLSTQLEELNQNLVRIAQERDKVSAALQHYSWVERDLAESLGEVSLSHNDQRATTAIEDLAHLSIPDAAYQILKERQPRSTSEIIEELTKRGKDFSPNSVAAVLRRDRKQRFIKERRGKELYWHLRDHPMKAEEPSQN